MNFYYNIVTANDSVRYSKKRVLLQVTTLTTKLLNSVKK